jgi:hypothetical protein
MKVLFTFLLRRLPFAFLLVFLASCATADGTDANRRYIVSDGYADTNTIKVSSIDDFQFLLRNNDIVVVFLREIESTSIRLLSKTELFFPAKNGEVYVVDALGYRSLEDFKKGKEAGFPNGNTYYEAIRLGINTFDIYDYYMKNSFVSPSDAEKSFHMGFVNMAKADIPLTIPMQLSIEQMEVIVEPLALAHQARESVTEPPVSFIRVDDNYEPVDRHVWMITTGEFPRAAFRNSNSRNTPQIAARTTKMGGTGTSISTQQYGYLRHPNETFFYFYELPDSQLLAKWGFTETDLQMINSVYRGQRNVSRSTATVRLFEESSTLYTKILLEAFHFNRVRPTLDAIAKTPKVDSDWYYSALLMGVETKEEYELVSIAYNHGFVNYSDYQQMLDLGFHQKREHLEATDRGLNTADDLELSNKLATNEISVINQYRDNMKTLEDIRILTGFDSYVDSYLYFILSVIKPGSYSVESIKVEMDSYSVDLFYDAYSTDFCEQRSKWQTGYRTDFSGRTNVMSAIDRGIMTVSSGKLHDILSSRDWEDFGIYDQERRMFTKRR